MAKRSFITAASAMIWLIPSVAQTVTHSEDHVSYYSSDGPGSPAFLIHRGERTIEQDGGWSKPGSLDSYAAAHAGDYIVFQDHGVLHRLNDPRALAEVFALQAPMAALEARQAALAAEQKPLAEQQHALSAKMHAAASPEEQASVGRQQGEVGRQQGEIGRKQGEVGREQGKVGRAVHDRVMQLIETCLQNGSCGAAGS